MKPKVLHLLRTGGHVKNGIASTNLHAHEGGKSILFLFDKGQQLSEHSAPFPAVMHFLEGEASVRLDGKAVSAKSGTWIFMPPHLPHAIKARTRVRMLLNTFKPSRK